MAKPIRLGYRTSRNLRVTPTGVVGRALDEIEADPVESARRIECETRFRAPKKRPQDIEADREWNAKQALDCQLMRAFRK